MPVRTRRSRRSRRARGFTLVELLVVIGIIALLISILLPSLNQARRSAKKVVCLSNVRQVFTGYNFYANDNRDAMPIGYHTYNYTGPSGAGVDLHQFNFNIFEQNAFLLFGVLIGSGEDPGYLRESPEVFFCPSQQDQNLSFNTPTNPFPERVNTPIRSSYSSRPAMGVQGDDDYRPFRWTYKIDAAHTDPLTGAPQRYWSTLKDLPKRINLHNAAIFADFCAQPAPVNSGHEDGINVLYATGGAHYVPRKTFDDRLKLLPASFNAAANDDVDRLWKILDEN